MRGFFYSVRLRLTLWYVAILALVLLIFSVALYEVEQGYLQSALDGQLYTRMQQIANTYDSHGGRLLLGAQTQNQKQPLSEVALLLTSRGDIVQSEIPAALPTKALLSMATQALGDNAPGQSPKTYTLWVRGGPLPDSTFRISSMPLRQGAYLLVVGLLSDVPRQMAALGRTLLIVAPLVLLLCAAGGYWLADRALRPVRAITRTARHINETDLSRRLGLRRRDELGELGATIDAMLDRLEAAFARQRQFTADASHELRTPLAVVDLVAARTLGQPRTPEEYRQTIATMQRENGAMSRLVNDLLTLARADSGRAAFRREAVDLGEVVLDAVERLAPLAHRNGMAVTLGAMADAHAAGDRLYLTQLVTNLLENALTHGARGGGHVCIETGQDGDAGGAWAWLRVADDGQGIAAEHLPHLCERFYRADPARTRTSAVEGAGQGAASAGSGLGLAIAQWIVQTHGGVLTIRSEPGHGATVEARLPAATSPHSAMLSL